ncbi:LexA family protein [Acidaminococcus provencensis]|uniref:LexA family protein n=1 Tax=Acidaminococcus provencensis TaxID=2058289 RepID=UPI00190E8B6A|nr:S24 family peptidase [Acidaminococcus provencensis]
MKPVKDIIKAKRLELGMTMKELAEKVGVSEGTVSRWESGEIENMRRNVIVSLAKALKLTPAVLMGWNDPEPSSITYTLPPSHGEDSVMVPVPGGYRIPVLGKVVAGVPINAVTDISGFEEIPEQMGRAGEFFALEIKGRSMEPTLHEGDVVIVRQQPEVENGEIAIVLINGDEATVKEVKESPEGLTLIGHNVAIYTPHFYNRKEIESLPIQILGKVVELRRKF